MLFYRAQYLCGGGLRTGHGQLPESGVPFVGADIQRTATGIARNVGGDTPRVNTTHMHSAAAHFLAQGLGKTPHAEFGGVIGRLCRNRDDTEQAGDIDQMPLGRLLQQRQERHAALDHSPEIDSHEPVEVFVAHLVDPVPEPQPEPDEEEEIRSVGTFGFWGAGMRPGDLRFELDNTEIQALDGVRFPSAAIPSRSNAGGFAFGVGMRPVSWMRVPEIRIAFGGGNVQSLWTALPDQPDLEVAFERMWQLRIEALAGVEYDIGRITPFVRGWAALAIYGGRVKARHAELGNLGTETVGEVRGELGIEAGMNIRLGGPVGLMLAYRRGLLGATAHGAMIGFSILGD